MEIIERISDLLAERDKTAIELCKVLDIQTSTMSTWKLSAMDEELLDLFHELPMSKQYEFMGEIKGFLRAVEDSKKYVDEGKRLSG